MHALYSPCILVKGRLWCEHPGGVQGSVGAPTAYMCVHEEHPWQYHATHGRDTVHVVVVCTGIAVRMPMSYLAVGGAGLTVLERVFVAVAWTPKVCATMQHLQYSHMLACNPCMSAVRYHARTRRNHMGRHPTYIVCVVYLSQATVQAALGPLPLDTILAKEGPDSPNIAYAEAVLTTSVLAILVCGTFGVLGIHILAPKFLAAVNDPSPGTAERKLWLAQLADHAQQGHAEAGMSTGTADMHVRVDAPAAGAVQLAVPRAASGVGVVTAVRASDRSDEQWLRDVSGGQELPPLQLADTLTEIGEIRYVQCACHATHTHTHTRTRNVCKSRRSKPRTVRLAPCMRMRT